MKTEIPERETKPAAPTSRAARNLWIKTFDEISIEDVPSVGGKTASLGEMFRELSPQGVKVPDGFAITAEAYRNFLSTGGLDRKIDRSSARADTQKPRGATRLRRKSSRSDSGHVLFPTRSGMKSWPPTIGCAQAATPTRASPSAAAPRPRTCRTPALPGSRKRISTSRGTSPARGLPALLRVALHRSGHFLPRGQGVRPPQDRALDRRAAHGAVGSGASGVMFSIDTETGFRDAVLINAAYGLGENVVQGSVNPDEYYVFKPTLKTGLPADPAEDGRAPRNSSWSTTSAAARW